MFVFVLCEIAEKKFYATGISRVYQYPSRTPLRVECGPLLYMFTSASTLHRFQIPSATCIQRMRCYRGVTCK